MNNLGQIYKKYGFYLQVLLMVLLLSTISYFLFKPLLGRVWTKYSIISSATKTLDEEKEKGKRIETLKIRVEELQDKKEMIYTKLPTSEEISTLLRQLETTSLNKKARLVSIKISQTQSQKNQKEKTTSSKEKTNSVSLEIVVRSSLGNFLEFLESLEDFPRSLSVESLNYSLDEKTKEVNGKMFINAYYEQSE